MATAGETALAGIIDWIGCCMKDGNLSHDKIDELLMNQSENGNIQTLVGAGLGSLVQELAIMEMKEKLIVPGAVKFHDFLLNAGEKEQSLTSCLKTCLEVASHTANPLVKIAKSIDKAFPDEGTCARRVGTIFNDLFLIGDSRALCSFRNCVKGYLASLLKDHHRRALVESMDDADTGDSCSEKEDNDEAAGSCEQDILPLEEFSKYIVQLEWFSLCEEPLSEVLCKETEKHVLKRCRERFDTGLLSRVCSWLDSVVLAWLLTVLEGCLPDKLRIQEKFHQWKARLEFHVFETLCNLRMSELFDIITDFPDSSSALEDLKDCLLRTHQYRELVMNLRQILATRLLHPGANTAQILDVYIATIKALRLLDPTGVLLEAISEPIKNYLRKRNDTVRCIVTSLTDDSNSDLYEELGRGENMQPIAQNFDESDDENEDAEETEEWKPDPIGADSRKTSRSRRSSDILGMLIHIYGSKELFVNEYRLMLADKLLTSLDFDAEREVRNLELLKLRFGESSLLQCEIMIKDIEDSKRINANIKKTLRGRGPENNSMVEDLDVTIVSKQFWPGLHGEDIQVHPAIQKRMKDVSHEYSVLKNPRSLVWKTNLGLAHLELEFDNGKTKDYYVNPLLATIMLHVCERPLWKAYDLAEVTGLDVDVLNKRIAYWVSLGVVRSQRNSKGETTYAAVENLSEDHSAVNVHNEEGANESAVSADAQLAEEMMVYESFVRGMLNNYDSLPLEKIHNNLKMFVSVGEHKYDKSTSQLASFLDSLVAKEVLVCTSDGGFALKKR